jgi:RNA ligase (TIGR02306 family)
MIIELIEHQDVTEILNIKKYDPEKEFEEKQIKERKIKNPILKFLYRFSFFRIFIKTSARRIPFPSHLISKTDEERIQNIPEILDEIQGKKVYITEKLDGQSGTFILFKNKFMVCSRNMNLPKDNSNWWKIKIQFDIENKLKDYRRDYGFDIAIQGEIIGEGIQENKYKIKGLDFYVFNVFNISTREYFNYQTLKWFCEEFNFKIVPIVYFDNFDFDFESLIKYSNSKSVLSDILREGIVVRTVDQDKKRISFKVINPEFLLKYNC